MSSKSLVLATSPYGFAAPYRDGKGARGKVQILDLESRRLSPITSPTVMGCEHVERDQDNPRWVVDRTGSPLDLADEFSSGLQPFVAPLSLPSEGMVSSAIMLIQHCLADLEPGRPSRNPARVRLTCHPGGRPESSE
jgi:hypothetical protein